MKLSTFEMLKHARPAGGFFLDETQLRELHRVLLFMLKDLNDLAEENGVTLTLGGGTVLGAVRHQGFVPWDDDIDLNVERRDYDRFIALIRTRRADRYWVHTPRGTHDYGILSTRIRLKGTSLKMREDAYGDECGVTVDLFPLENTFDLAPLRLMHGVMCMGMGFLLSCRKFFRDRKQLRPLLAQIPGGRSAFAVKTVLGFLVSWGSVDFWTRAGDACYRMCRNDRSKYVTFPTGRKKFFGELCLRGDYCDIQKVPFEDGLFWCTKNADAYMKRLFGDYETPPPPEDREKHIFFSYDMGSYGKEISI